MKKPTKAKKPRPPRRAPTIEYGTQGYGDEPVARSVDVSKLDLPVGPVSHPAGSRLKKPKGPKHDH